MSEGDWRRGGRAAAAVTLSVVAVAAVVFGAPMLAAAHQSSASPRTHRIVPRARAIRNVRSLAARLHSAPPLQPAAVSTPLNARTVAADPRIGALFFTNANGSLSDHFCTATVVSSPAKDLIVTAAHCVYSSGYNGYATGLAFVPGYDNGKQPYGVWKPTKIMVASQWTASENPDYDVAFLTVGRGGDRDLQDLTGSYRMAFNQPYHQLVRVIGYPTSSNGPVSCDDYTTEQSATQLEWNCGGYPTGTSGSPFLNDIDPLTGSADVSGVIGGYETGGDTDSTSYSAYFGAGIASLYHSAAATG